jgi:hypothetical protein
MVNDLDDRFNVIMVEARLMGCPQRMITNTFDYWEKQSSDNDKRETLERIRQHLDQIDSGERKWPNYV